MLEKLLKYHFACNQRLGEFFTGNAKAWDTEKVSAWYSHLIHAHHIWNQRILRAQPKFGVWQKQGLTSLLELDKKNHAESLRLVKSLPPTTSISYTNSTGKTYQNSLEDILLHVVNHGTYHRGQIASALRKAGIDPLPSDYILFGRTE